MAKKRDRVSGGRQRHPYAAGSRIPRLHPKQSGQRQVDSLGPASWVSSGMAGTVGVQIDRAIMEIRFRCTEHNFQPQPVCSLRRIGQEEWSANRRRWEIYSDWGPQKDVIEKIYQKGSDPYALFIGDKVIACAIRLPRTETEDEIGSVWVHPDYRGQGLGRRIVAYVVQLILDDGKAAIYATREDNTASQHVATSVGFKRIESG